MHRIADALELLTAQHADIDTLVAEISTSASSAMRDNALTELADQLTMHLAIEQELFYPALSSTLSDDVRAELMAEQGEIKRVLADLLWLDHDDTHFASKLATLRTLLEWHEVWQESQLFETIVEQTTNARLTELGAQMNVWMESTVVFAQAA